MSDSNGAAAARDWPRRWRCPRLIADPRLRWALLIGALVCLLVGLASLEVSWARVADGWERGLRFLAGFVRPDFAGRWGDIQQGLVESLTMSLTATAVGILISLPIGIGAARNLAPLPLYLGCHAVIAVSRSLQ